MKARYPLIVIGAGPAGLAAAAAAAAAGVETALLDEQPAPGGQIYRNIESMPAARMKHLGSEYRHGVELVRSMRGSAAHWFSETAVWSLSGQRELGIIQQGEARLIHADHVLIATGAQERPVPFPGWTLPGVMNAGAGQILLKQAGIVPSDGVVLAGSGPLLLLLAWQYVRAGVAVQAVLDVQPMLNWMRAALHLPKALMAHHYITKGLAYKRELKAAGVVTLHGIQDLRAVGGDHVHAVEFIHRNSFQRMDTPLLLTHFGVIPQTHLSRAAGCGHQWDKAQQCWQPVADEWGATDVEGISVAGDGAIIGGARAAEHEGRLAGLDAAYRLGGLDRQGRDRQARQDLRGRKAEMLIRPFLDAMFRPPGIMLTHPTDEEVLCRCEEVTAGDIRCALDEGHRSPNQVKFYTRCGMGPCQGRQCADSVAQLIAYETGQNPRDVQPYRVRTPIKPITIGQMAALDKVVNTDVLIVGGGLVGSSTALYLAMRNVRGIVLDRDHPGRHSSGINAGGLRKLNRHPAEIPLALEAGLIWSNISALVDSDCDVKLSGQARVAENQADLEILEAREALVRMLGFDHEQMIGRERLYELIPSLSPHCVGALWCEGDGYARPYHATTAFRRKAESLGVTYQTGTALNELEREGDTWVATTRQGEIRAPILVNAAGAWGARLAAVAGDHIPLEPGAPTLMVTERLPHFIDPVVGAASRKLSFKQMQNGTVVIGGAHRARLDMARERTEIDYRSMAESARSVTALFPHMADARIVRFWAGIEGFTPDNIPVIGPSPNARGLFHAFGFSAHGFQLSPVVGRILSELILDGRSTLPIDPFRPGRFTNEA